MNVLCITSIEHPALQAVAELLHQAGFVYAKDSSDAGDVDIRHWHQRVLAQYGTKITESHATPLGRVWEQLAIECFKTHLDAPLWGWVDSNSVHLLEFWHEFDPQIYFVLVHISLEHTLAQAITETTDELNVSARLEHWRTTHQAMLRFHLRHPERSILLAAEEALQHPEALLARLNERWPLALDSQNLTPAQYTYPDPIALHFATELCQQHPQSLELSNELLSTQEFLGQGTSVTLNIPTMIRAYHQIRDRSHEQGQIQQLQDQLISLSRQQENSIREQDDLKAQLNQFTKEKTELAKQLDTHKTLAEQTKQQIRESQEEADLLLAQLHQVQEELENFFLKEQQTRKERDEQAKLAQEHKTRAEQLTKDKTELTKQLDAHKTRAERLNKEKTDVHRQLVNSQGETKLILSQLHKSQEEAQHYFLQNQQTQQQLQDSEQRLAKILKRYPDYWDYANLDISPLPEVETTQASQWQFTELALGNRLIPELRFTLQLHDSLAGLCIQRQNDQSTPLLYWPDADATELLCLPNAGGLHQGNNAMLTRLRYSDWQLLQSLIASLIEILSSETLALPEPLNRTMLRQGLVNLQHSLANWPLVARFDHVQLLDNAQLPQYDSLDIHLDKLQLGKWQWSNIHYRIASVDPQADAFGTYPRLEFHENAQQALSRWFAETNDERGTRLELRFAPPGDMDLGVWNQLADSDQLLISTLISTLPQQLAELEHQQAKITRPWQDWVQLSGQLKRILANYINNAPRSQKV